MSVNPVFNPVVNCPFDIENEHRYVLYGVLLALVEHQQIVALRNWENTVARRYKKSAFYNPSLHIPPVLLAAQAHQDRLAKYGWQQHLLLVNRVIDALPERLDPFIPQYERYVPERAYRKMASHLRRAWNEYRQAKYGTDASELPEVGDVDENVIDEDGEQDAAE